MQCKLVAGVQNATGMIMIYMSGCTGTNDRTDIGAAKPGGKAVTLR
jgi:hypothetical protein